MVKFPVPRDCFDLVMGAIINHPESGGLAGLWLRGQFLAHLVQRALDGIKGPGEQELTRLVPGELLQMAKAWKKDPEKVLAGLR